jgi:CubicO group peptidase (beta-lactamase class C family)
MSNTYAAGGLYSTVEDLYRWEQALFSGDVVSQETWDAMLDVAVPIAGNAEFRYGYGLFIDTTGEHTTIGHSGNINGFVSAMTHLPDEDMTIIILSNLETANITPPLLDSIVQALLGET